MLTRGGDGLYERSWPYNDLVIPIPLIKGPRMVPEKESDYLFNLSSEGVRQADFEKAACLMLSDIASNNSNIKPAVGISPTLDRVFVWGISIPKKMHKVVCGLSPNMPPIQRQKKPRKIGGNALVLRQRKRTVQDDDSEP